MALQNLFLNLLLIFTVSVLNRSPITYTHNGNEAYIIKNKVINNPNYKNEANLQINDIVCELCKVDKFLKYISQLGSLEKYVDSFCGTTGSFKHSCMLLGDASVELYELLTKNKLIEELCRLYCPISNSNKLVSSSDSNSLGHSNNLNQFLSDMMFQPQESSDTRQSLCIICKFLDNSLNIISSLDNSEEYLSTICELMGDFAPLCFKISNGILHLYENTPSKPPIQNNCKFVCN